MSTNCAKAFLVIFEFSFVEKIGKKYFRWREGEEIKIFVGERGKKYGLSLERGGRNMDFRWREGEEIWIFRWREGEEIRTFGQNIYP